MRGSEKDAVRANIQRSKDLIALADTLIVNPAEREKLYRRALSSMRSAFNWSNRDTDILEELHRVGRVVHDEFGCQVTFRGNQYWKDCPVVLSHVPFGFSIGGSATKRCSICGQDPLDCTHIRGKEYENVRCSKQFCGCNICFREKCEHVAGEFYNKVQARHIITKMDLDHVAIVSKPADPDACMTTISIDKQQILSEVDSLRLEWGQTAYCNHCVSCTGKVKGNGN